MTSPQEFRGAAAEASGFPAALFHLGTVLALAAATLAIVSTYGRLSHTVDEPVHVAAGLEWLERGTQRLHAENPPLSRVGAGLGAYLAGRRLGTGGRVFQLGTDVLYENGAYLANLSLARAGTLPFFLLSALLVWGWAHRLGGARAAFLSTASFATLPPVLGHAGLATTDVAFMAMLLLALGATVAWWEAPNGKRAAGCGLAIGLALATKFSTLLFLPAALLGVLVVDIVSRGPRLSARPSPGARSRARQVAVVAGTSLLLVWAVYGFSVGSIADRPQMGGLLRTLFPDEDGFPRRAAGWLTRIPVPAPDGLYGLFFLFAHGVKGHLAYLFGRESQDGFWNFYLAALAFKTPLAFLLFGGLGFTGALRGGTGRREAFAPAAAALGILLVASAGSIHMGVRHVLPVYPLVALTAGLGLDRWLRASRGRGRRTLGALGAMILGWQGAAAAAAHPDHLAFFNPLAGEEPGRILVDSDLDWGQDALQLEEYFRERPAERLHVAYFGGVRLCELDLPPLEWLPPGRPVTGWVAISEMYFRDHWHLVYEDACDRTRSRAATERGGYAWLAEHEPVARAGRSIRIYRLPGN